MKKYCFYLINDDFYDLFKGDNLKAFLELYFRKVESSYYSKQFNLFVSELNFDEFDAVIKEKFMCRKDFCVDGNVYSLDNFITSNKEILKLNSNNIEVQTDYEVSPFINTLSDNFPELVGIDINNSKIERVGLVSSIKIS